MTFYRCPNRLIRTQARHYIYLFNYITVSNNVLYKSFLNNIYYNTSQALPDI